jgi:hypothetical protein
MIPVVLVDGLQHGYWKVSERRLRAALTGRQGWRPPRRSSPQVSPNSADS